MIAAIILLIVLWGFHRTYTVFFPAFEGFQFVQHFHGFMMLLWLLMLIVQPLFIARRKYSLHRMVGSASYVVAPLILLSIFLVSRMVFHRNMETRTPADAYAELALSLPGLVAFAIFYWLAIRNRHQTYYHMRYMIGTGLLMIGPGLGRILGIWFGVPGPLVVTSTLIAVAVTGIVFLVVDIVKRQDIRPYAIVAALLVWCAVLWEIRYSDLWQGLATFIARIAFVPGK